MYGRTHRIHFVGIGGVGMCGIAEVLLNLGYQVSGSDLRGRRGHRAPRRRWAGASSRATRPPTSRARRWSSTRPRSSADNPEVRGRARAGHPGHPARRHAGRAHAHEVRRRGGRRARQDHHDLAGRRRCWRAAGSTRPSSWAGGCSPSARTRGSGHGQFLVAEADESDGSFLRLSPAVAVITNIDREHLDHYGSLEELRQAFIYFANRVPFYGVAVLCADDPQVRGILPQRDQARTCSTAPATEAALRAVDVRARPGGLDASASCRDGERAGRGAAARCPGTHNVLNALAAVAVGLELEVPFAHIAEALGTSAAWAAASRRAARRAACGSSTTTATTRPRSRPRWRPRARWAGACWSLFQPHRYTRTRAPAPRVRGLLRRRRPRLVLGHLRGGRGADAGRDRAHHRARAPRRWGTKHARLRRRRRRRASRPLAREARPGDLVLTLGAGDVWKLGRPAARAAARRGGRALMGLYQGRALDRGPRRDAGRPAQRAPAGRRRGRRPALRPARIVLALAGLAVAAGRRASWCRGGALRERFAVVQDVRVEGARYLDAGARRRGRRGARGRRPVRVDCERARQALLLDPRIARAEVERGPGCAPCGVRIVEREPVLLVRARGAVGGGLGRRAAAAAGAGRRGRRAAADRAGLLAGGGRARRCARVEVRRGPGLGAGAGRPRPAAGGRGVGGGRGRRRSHGDPADGRHRGAGAGVAAGRPRAVGAARRARGPARNAAGAARRGGPALRGPGGRAAGGRARIHAARGCAGAGTGRRRDGPGGDRRSG